MAVTSHPLRTRRVYEPARPGDGVRVLSERLWPRGLRKEDARIDLWLKEIAPSPALRQWYGHEPAKWEEFRRRYLAELEDNPDDVGRLRALLAEGPVTLVYASQDEQRNSTALLKEWLER
jgi:uncharacterized protein YeaO (DUF488 family)